VFVIVTLSSFVVYLHEWINLKNVLIFPPQALKTKHDTPKYGLIYHAQLVGQASTKLKGKVRSVVLKSPYLLNYSGVSYAGSKGFSGHSCGRPWGGY